MVVKIKNDISPAYDMVLLRPIILAFLGVYYVHVCEVHEVAHGHGSWYNASKRELRLFMAGSTNYSKGRVISKS